MKRYFLLLLLFAMLLAAAGCGGEKAKEPPGLLPIEAASESEIPEFILSELVDPTQENYYALGDVPGSDVLYLVATAGEKPEGYEIVFSGYLVNADRTWDVYLKTKEPQKGKSGVAFPVACAVLNPTPPRYPIVVRFHVDGQKKADLAVTRLEMPLAETFLELYFGTPKAYLRQERRPAPSGFEDRSIEEQAGIIFAELLKGPGEDGDTMAVIPAGTELLAAEHEPQHRHLKVRVSGHFANAQGSAGEMLAVYSLVNSLTQLEGVDTVTIEVEGGEMQHLDMLENLTFSIDLME